MFVQFKKRVKIIPIAKFTIPATIVKLRGFLTLWDTTNLSSTFINPQINGEIIAKINGKNIGIAIFPLLLF
jgi:hypothetical protein